MKSLKDRKSVVYSRAKRTNIRGFAKSNSEVYLNLAAKTLFVLSGIILLTSFVFILAGLPSHMAGNWENVFFVSREAHWKIITAGLFAMLLGMIFYIIAFLLSKK